MRKGNRKAKAKAFFFHNDEESEQASDERLVHAIGQEDAEKQVEPATTQDVATMNSGQEDPNNGPGFTTNNVTARPRPPLHQPNQPGAYRVGDDTQDQEEETATEDAESTSAPSPNVTPSRESSALPIAAEVATDLEEVVAERELLKKQLKELQEERRQDVVVVQADAVPLEEKEGLGISNAPRKLKKATGFNLFSTRRPKNAVAGMSSGAKSIGKGFFAGFACLFTEPVAGAQEDGPKGFVKGCATGVGKAVSLPVAGTFVGLYQMGRGAANSVTSAVSKQKEHV